MAKFKVGDKVKIVGEPQSKIFIIEDVVGNGVNAAYFVKGRPDVGYQESYLTLANSRACNGVRSCTSTNSVVRNAVAANSRVARNDTWVDYSDDASYVIRKDVLGLLNRAKNAIYGNGTQNQIALLDQAINHVKSAYEILNRI